MIRALSYPFFICLILLLTLFLFRVEVLNYFLKQVHPELEVKVHKLFISPKHLEIRKLTATHRPQNTLIAHCEEIHLHYSWSELFSSPTVLESLTLKKLTVGLAGAMAAKELEFSSSETQIPSESPSSESKTDQASRYQLKHFELQQLKIDNQDFVPFDIPAVPQLSIHDIDSKHFHSLKDLFRFIIKSIVRQVKEKKILEGLFKNTLKLPKNILEQGIKTPEQLFQLLPELLNNDTQEQKAPTTSRERNPVKEEKKLKPEERLKRELKKILPFNDSKKEEKGSIEESVIQGLEGIFKGIPEKLFENP